MDKGTNGEGGGRGGGREGGVGGWPPAAGGIIHRRATADFTTAKGCWLDGRASHATVALRPRGSIIPASYPGAAGGMANPVFLFVCIMSVCVAFS